MTCRELIKLGAVAGVSALAGRLGAVEPAVKPLRILILGGTVFSGPHPVRYLGLELVTSFGLTNALPNPELTLYAEGGARPRVARLMSLPPTEGVRS
jgi:hypothetical protein